MVTVEQIVAWGDKQGFRVVVTHDKVMLGPDNTEVLDMSSYRPDPSKPDMQTVWYAKYNLFFNPKTREVIFGTFPEFQKEYDIRNHPNWNL